MRVTCHLSDPECGMGERSLVRYKWRRTLTYVINSVSFVREMNTRISEKKAAAERALHEQIIE